MISIVIDSLLLSYTWITRVNFFLSLTCVICSSEPCSDCRARPHWHEIIWWMCQVKPCTAMFIIFRIPSTSASVTWFVRNAWLHPCTHTRARPHSFSHLHAYAHNNFSFRPAHTLNSLTRLRGHLAAGPRGCEPCRCCRVLVYFRMYSLFVRRTSSFFFWKPLEKTIGDCSNCFLPSKGTEFILGLLDMRTDCHVCLLLPKRTGQKLQCPSV